MEVAAGTHLGPFEILAPLGAGGMGEVYRARDPRLGRDVAIKILPADQRADPDRIRRFEQEARAVGALNHPNILSVYDVSVYGGTTCLVTELLDGETLRERLARGPVPPHKAMELAIQIAEGLAAAHERDIVHRDLKPDNVFVTREGRVKILDFGLAKFLAVGDTTEGGSTLPAGTSPGAILGTMGYMAPEQVRGQPADARADIFAFGAILHEMLAGTRAFRRDTPIETGYAILNDDPPELPGIEPALANIVGRCLEKRPEERFQSARDIAFALDALSEGSSSGRSAAAPAARPRARWMRWLPLVASALLAAGGTVEWVMARRGGSGEPPIYRRLTFRRGTILSARFTPDGQSVVYGAAWDGKPFEVFTTRPGAPESRPLGLADASPLAVSPSGELAVLVHVRLGPDYSLPSMLGTLAQVPLDGGAPREVLEDVSYADWDPDGAGLAAIRRVTVDGQTKFQVEFPIGHVLFGAGGWLRYLRFSPDGKRLAFVDDHGITVIGREGKPTRIGDPWDVRGLAWSRSGEEIIFAGEGPGRPLAVRGVTLAGRERVIARIAGALTVHDVSAEGRVLVTSDRLTREMKVLAPGETQERDLSWLDNSSPSELSADGKTVLFGECGEAVHVTEKLREMVAPSFREKCTAYVRRTDGSSPTRLGEGWPDNWSPDGQWVVMRRENGAEMVPTGPGSPRPLPTAGTIEHDFLIWSRDGKRVVFEGQEPGHRPRVWVQDYPQGTPHAVTDEGTVATVSTSSVFSPDGKRLALTFDTELRIVPVEGGPAVQSFPLRWDESALQWTADGTAIYIVGHALVLPLRLRIDLLDLASGRRERWRELAPADATGAITIFTGGLTSDGRAYLYSVARHLSELYVVDGVSLQ